MSFTEEPPSPLSKRDLDFFPEKEHLEQASLSLSQHSELRPHGNQSPDSKLSVHHSNSSSIAPTPSLGVDGGSGNLGDGAHGIHLLLGPPDLLTPSQFPPLNGHSPPTPSPPTLLTNEDPDSAQSTEVDWGSGDYLETMTFMGSEGDQLSHVTTVPTHRQDSNESDDDSDNGISYNTDFPSRHVPTLSSRHLLPSVTAGFDTSLRTPHPTDPRLPHIPAIALDDVDFDWAELYPIEPTEMLLPDMNSLEYYNTLQAKENASAARNQTRLVPPHIVPTATHTHPAGSTHTLAPSMGVSPPMDQVDVPLFIPGVTPTPLQKTPISPAPTEHRLPPKKSFPRPTLQDSKGVSAQPGGATTPHVVSQGPAIQAVTLQAPSPPKLQTVPKAIPTKTAATTTTVSTKPPPPAAPRSPFSTTSRQYACNITKPDMYLVRVGKFFNCYHLQCWAGLKLL